MYHVLIIHEVDDYAAWKKGFDQASALCKSAGEIVFQILKYADEPNKIVDFSKWHSRDLPKVLLNQRLSETIGKTWG